MKLRNIELCVMERYKLSSLIRPVVGQQLYDSSLKVLFLLLLNVWLSAWHKQLLSLLLGGESNKWFWRAFSLNFFIYSLYFFLKKHERLNILLLNLLWPIWLLCNVEVDTRYDLTFITQRDQFLLLPFAMPSGIKLHYSLCSSFCTFTWGIAH